MGRRRIRVVVVDDNPAVRKSVIRILEELGKRIEVVAEAGDGEEFLAVAEATPADVFLVDIEMPVLGGIEAIERLVRAKPESKVLVLSMYRDRRLVERAFQAGARGYILKEGGVEDLVRAVEEVYRSGRWPGV